MSVGLSPSSLADKPALTVISEISLSPCFIKQIVLLIAWLWTENYWYIVIIVYTDIKTNITQGNSRYKRDFDCSFIKKLYAHACLFCLFSRLHYIFFPPSLPSSYPSSLIFSFSLSFFWVVATETTWPCGPNINKIVMALYQSNLVEGKRELFWEIWLVKKQREGERENLGEWFEK